MTQFTECDAMFGGLPCVHPAGHPGWHQSRRGTSWRVSPDRTDFVAPLMASVELDPTPPARRPARFDPPRRWFGSSARYSRTLR